MNSKIVQIIFILILLGLNGCPKKKPKPVSGKPIEEKGIVTVKKIEEEREARYRYAGEKGRETHLLFLNRGQKELDGLVKGV